MPGDHYYDLDSQPDQAPASISAGLEQARRSTWEARARVRELILIGAEGPHAAKALELLDAAVAEIDSAIAAGSGH
jgi:hypothetical protein